MLKKPKVTKMKRKRMMKLRNLKVMKLSITLQRRVPLPLLPKPNATVLYPRKTILKKLKLMEMMKIRIK